MFKSVILSALVMCISFSFAQADGLFGKNRMDDQFRILSIEEGGVFKVEGVQKDLKVGDTLYATKSPFHGKVAEIKGKEISVKASGQGEIKEGMVFLRYPTDPIKKAIETEKRLKAAIEE